MHAQHQAGRRTVGFTLIELLVVITIIMVLIGILMPAIRGMKKNAQRKECLNAIRNFGNACLLYAAQNEGRLPAGGNYADLLSVSPTMVKEMASGYGLIRTTAGCRSYWRKPESQKWIDSSNPQECLGWIYYGNRTVAAPQIVPQGTTTPAGAYRLPRSVSSDASSSTLVICRAYTSASGSGSMVHGKSDEDAFTTPARSSPYISNANDPKDQDTMGLNVFKTDGSGRWVNFERLGVLTDNQRWYYYEPD